MFFKEHCSIQCQLYNRLYDEYDVKTFVVVSSLCVYIRDTCLQTPFFIDDVPEYSIKFSLSIRMSLNMVGTYVHISQCYVCSTSSSSYLLMVCGLYIKR